MTDRTVVYRLTADIGQFKAQMAQAGASVRKAGADMTAGTKEGEKFRRGLDSVGTVAGGVGLVAAAGLGVAISKAADFDQAMSNIRAATHETAENMNLLRDAALTAGEETVYSATEAAGAIENLSKAGVSTKDILGGALTGALDLAAAGQLDVAEAAEYTATALTQFQLSGDQATHVADLLAAGAGKAQGEVRDMALALNYAGVPASNLGVSIEETAGTIALLAKNGVIGEQAGTSLRGMLASLTSPSQVAAKEMANLGIEVFDAQGKFVGFEGVAAQLETQLGGLTDAERANALGKIFGNEQLQAANVLYREGADGLRAMASAVDDQGYAAETAATRLDNLKGDLEGLGGALETAFIGTGDGGQGALRSTVQWITEAVNAYNDLGDGAKKGVGIALGATMALGGGLFIFSKLVQGVANTRGALDDLGINLRRTKTDLDDVGASSDRASDRLSKMARTGAGIAAVGTAVGALADGVGRIDSANLERGLQALSMGEVTGDLQQVIDGLEWIESWDNAVDLGEVFTAGGLFGDSTKDKIQDNIEQVDQSLAQLVETGEEVQAADLFERIIEQSGEAGVSAEDTRKHFDAYALALRNAKEAEDQAANSADRTSGAFERTGDAVGGIRGELRLTEAELKSMQDALDDARQEATGVARQFVNLGSSVNDSKVSLGDWIKQMAKQAEALRNFRVNAKEAADKGLRNGLIKELQAAGPEGALRMRQLANATKSEIGRANEAWGAGQREVKKYVDATVKVPKELKTDVKANTAAAIGSVNAFEQRLRNLKDETVNVTTVYTTVRREIRGSNLGPREEAADGATVPNTGLPYADRHPYMLADLEEVISNRYGQADRYRPVLKAINRNAPREVVRGMLADGGTVGWLPGLAGGGTVEERLAVAQAEQRIRELMKAINATGKNRLGPNEREIAKLELRAAKEQLAAAEAGIGQKRRDDIDARIRHEEEQRKAQAEDEQRRADVEHELQKLVAQSLLDAAEDQREAAQAQHDAATEQLKAAEAARDAFKESVASQHRGSLTGAGLAGMVQVLDRDINAGRSSDAGLRRLVELGLDTTGARSGIFTELAASEDLRTINELIAAGPAYIEMLEQRYAERDQVNADRGAFAADQVHGAVVAAGQAQVQATQALLNQATAAAAEAKRQMDVLTGVTAQNQAVMEAMMGNFQRGVERLMSLSGGRR